MPRRKKPAATVAALILPERPPVEAFTLPEMPPFDLEALLAELPPVELGLPPLPPEFETDFGAMFPAKTGGRHRTHRPEVGVRIRYYAVITMTPDEICRSLGITRRIFDNLYLADYAYGKAAVQSWLIQNMFERCADKNAKVSKKAAQLYGQETGLTPQAGKPDAAANEKAKEAAFTNAARHLTPAGQRRFAQIRREMGDRLPELPRQPQIESTTTGEEAEA